MNIGAKLLKQNLVMNITVKNVHIQKEKKELKI